MNAAETAQQLWERVKKQGQSLEALTAILNDYQSALESLAAADETLRSKLRLLREEIPDLNRLITRKHDAILQGRLQDGIGKLRKWVTPLAPEPEPPASEELPNPENPESPRPFRNMPNLGMD